MCIFRSNGQCYRQLTESVYQVLDAAPSGRTYAIETIKCVCQLLVQFPVTFEGLRSDSTGGVGENYHVIGNCQQYAQQETKT